MKLDYILVDDKYVNYGKVKHLFEHAFPSEERPPFSMMLSLDNNKLYAVEDHSEFVGLLSTVECEDLLYVFFLAVKKKYRQRGYGSQILKDVLDNNSGKRIFLMAEDPDIECDNKNERDNRIRFYSHNGFSKTDVKVTEYGVKYVLLTSGEKVDKEDFLKVMKHVTGDYYPIYLENVK